MLILGYVIWAKEIVLNMKRLVYIWLELSSWNINFKMLNKSNNIEKLVFTPFINTADEQWSANTFFPVTNSFGSNQNVTSYKTTLFYEPDTQNFSNQSGQELMGNAQPSSMDSSIIWTIFCDLLGAPCLVAFLYVLYRGIEVSYFAILNRRKGDLIPSLSLNWIENYLIIFM